MIHRFIHYFLITQQFICNTANYHKFAVSLRSERRLEIGCGRMVHYASLERELHAEALLCSILSAVAVQLNENVSLSKYL